MIKKVVFLFILVLVGCASPKPTESPLATVRIMDSPVATVPVPLEEEKFVVPTPGPGMGVLTGKLYTVTGNGPIPHTIFYLVPAIDGPEGKSLPEVLSPQKARGDIQGKSDAQGMFVLQDIPPDDYYMLIWRPYDWLVVQNPDSTPRLISIEPDNMLDLETISLSWP